MERKKISVNLNSKKEIESGDKFSEFLMQKQFGFYTKQKS